MLHINEHIAKYVHCRILYTTAGSATSFIASRSAMSFIVVYTFLFLYHAICVKTKAWKFLQVSRLYGM